MYEIRVDAGAGLDHETERLSAVYVRRLGLAGGGDEQTFRGDAAGFQAFLACVADARVLIADRGHRYVFPLLVRHMQRYRCGPLGEQTTILLDRSLAGGDGDGDFRDLVQRNAATVPHILAVEWRRPYVEVNASLPTAADFAALLADDDDADAARVDARRGT